jgi:predicted N-formylglutamate amidohydrolase
VNPAVAEEAWWGLGAPTAGGVLVVGDHASGFVPPDIQLGIEAALLTQHIALDIGVAEVARLLVEVGAADAGFLAGVSRLVIDLNRDAAAPGLIPLISDGHAIPGNALSDAARAERIERFYRPYHAKLAQVIAGARPAMIVSLHSFTPGLASDLAQARPWQIGILYNDDDRLARVALPAFTALGLTVGDQLPYSGRALNHTMNIDAEANGIPYLGIEMRQDMVADAAGQQDFAEMIRQIIGICRNHLASDVHFGQ